MPIPRNGEVITFYSYKGGTGRSMALANIAGLLAQEGKRVLAIDWDLEAPGLHRYFADRISLANDLDEMPGVADLMWRLCAHFGVKPGMTTEQARADATFVEEFDSIASQVDFQSLPIPVECGASTTGGLLHLIKAGAFREEYSRLVNTLPWEPLFHRAPGLFEAFSRYVSTLYDYALVDSRTGLTDTSGICSMLMPEKLVVVFTPNRQSLDGVLDLTRRALDYRMTAPDMRSLVIFPLASRIDNSETDLRKKWRDQKPDGYQPRFEELLAKSYGLDACDLESYFDAAQIPHSAFFSYGERVAVLEERVGDTLSMAQHYLRFKDRLVGDAHPWENPLAPTADTPWVLLDYFLTQLSEQELQTVRGILTRLVRPAGMREGNDTLLVCPPTDFPAVARPMIQRLERASVIMSSPSGDAIQLANEKMPRDWPALRDWIDADRDFLIWRDSLRSPMDTYRANPMALNSLPGNFVTTSLDWLTRRSADLTAAEIEFVMGAAEAYRGSSARLLASLAASELQRAASGDSAVRMALLAAESVGRCHTVEGDQILRDALAILPPLIARIEGDEAVGFLGTRTDAGFVASCNGNLVRFWKDIATDPRPLTFQFENAVCAIAASHDAKLIAVCDIAGHISMIRDFGSPSFIAGVPPGQTFLEFDYKDRLIAVPSSGGLFQIDKSLTNLLPVDAKVAVHRSSMDRKVFFLAFEGSTQGWVWHAGVPGRKQAIPLPKPCTRACFSSDNRQVAIAMPGEGSETLITVFELENLAVVATHRLTDKLDRLIFSPGDLGIVAITGGRTAQVLPVRAKTTAWRARIDSDVFAAAANARAGMIALGGADGAARLIDFASGRQLMRAEHGAAIRIARFFENGDRLVTAADDHSVCVWDVRGLREVMRVDHDEPVWDVQFHPSGECLVSVGNDVTQAIDFPGGHPRHRFRRFGRGVTSTGFSPDGAKLAVTNANGQTDVVSWADGETLARYYSTQTATCCAFSPDGTQLAIGGRAGLVSLIPQTPFASPAELVHGTVVWDVRFDPESKWLVAGDERGIRIWDVATGTLVKQITLPSACHCCLFTPDGRFIVTACDDGICRIFTLDGVEFFSIPNNSRVSGAAVSPDSEYIAVGGDDAVKIWSLASHQQIAQIRYDGEVQWLAFSPDGKHLAVASSDTTTRVWLWRGADLIAEAQRRTRRTLSAEEFAAALPSEVPRLAQDRLRPVLREAEIRRLRGLASGVRAEANSSEEESDIWNRLAAFGLIRKNQTGVYSAFDVTTAGRKFLREGIPGDGHAT